MTARTRRARRFGDELKRIGWVGDEEVGARKMHAYFELHIEQGPILEAEGKRDRRRHPRPGPVVAAGDADRQGGAYRLDADADARQCRPRHGADHRDWCRQIAMDDQPDAVGARRAISRSIPTRATSSPGKVVFTVDIRSPEPGKARRHGRAHRGRGARRSPRRSASAARSKQVGHFDPVTFDPTLVGRVRKAAEELGYSHRNIISGAGHDACWINRVAPAAMIMCPCVDGLSHNEAEEISQGMGGGRRRRAVPRGGRDGGDCGVRGSGPQHSRSGAARRACAEAGDGWRRPNRALRMSFRNAATSRDSEFARQVPVGAVRR